MASLPALIRRNPPRLPQAWLESWMSAVSTVSARVRS